MRTVLLVTWCLTLGVALAGTAVVVEGERLTLDREFGTKEPVEVVYKLYTATRGPDKVLVCVGYVTSNLPHEWFKVTLEFTAYYGYTDSAWPLGFIGPAGNATVVLQKPSKGARSRFAAFFKQPDGKVLRPDMIRYATATAEFVKLDAEAPKP